jgi:DNA repair protein RAD16
MEHQIDGVLWMMNQEDSDVRGGLNGDAMGLGKTGNDRHTWLTNPATTLALIHNNKDKHTLVAVPANLVQNWEQEIEKFMPGNNNVETLYNTTYILQSKRPKHKITLISHTLLRYVHSYHPTAWLFKFIWDQIVLDEGHFIVNRSGQLFAACVAVNARKHWVLSGNVYSCLFSPSAQELLVRIIQQKT